ncbi:MAG: YvcK family protein [Anaerolineales bacterium]|nr:YvcK family protein [Anaerolineales bacterium]
MRKIKDVYYYLRREVAGILRWLVPGLGVKRWFGLMLLGLTFLAVGLALGLLDIYRTTPPESSLTTVLGVVALQSLARPLRVLIFMSLGLLLIALGMAGLNRALIIPFVRPGQKLVDQIASYRRKGRGPRIVVLGGGHGLATLLRGLKNHSANLTAIVSVADDGGSSGRLRQTLGILPPGDIRNCLAALSDDEAMLTQLFQYRFTDQSGLGGHSFGNLFISALAEISGSFEEAVAESGRVLGVRGRVLPATLHNVRLVADVELPNQPGSVRVEGESAIPQMPGRVRRVWLEPNSPFAFPPAVRAILAADLIVIGPGSLYTSILPNLLVPDLLEALRASRALKAFVINIATQPGETLEYSVLDHIRVLEEHVGKGLPDVIVYNNFYDLPLPNTSDWVKWEGTPQNYPLYGANLVNEQHPWRHDSGKLAQTLMDLLFERTGPLTE